MTTERHISLSNEIALHDSELVIELQQTIIPAVTLEAAMLRYRISHSLRFSTSSQRAFRLTVADVERVSRATVTRGHSNELFFVLGRNQIDYLTAFLLRAHRDQVTEANHIHIEGTLESKPFDLTIMLEAFRAATPGADS